MVLWLHLDLIRFKLIFVKGIKSVSRKTFFFFSYIQLFWYHLLKACLFSFVIAFAPLSRVSCLYLYGAVSGLPVRFHYSICLFFHQYHTVLITTALW